MRGGSGMFFVDMCILSGYFEGYFEVFGIIYVDVVKFICVYEMKFDVL